MPFKMPLPNSSTLTFFSLLLFGLLSCNQTSNSSDNLKKVDTVKNNNVGLTSTDKQIDSIIEEKVIDTIFKLTEVKKRTNYIEQQTNGERHLKIWVADTPNLPDKKYYWIKVGEDNGTSLVTHFNFYVYPDSMRIMYYDINDDKEIGLDTWRRQLNGM